MLVRHERRGARRSGEEVFTQRRKASVPASRRWNTERADGGRRAAQEVTTDPSGTIYYERVAARRRHGGRSCSVDQWPDSKCPLRLLTIHTTSGILYVSDPTVEIAPASGDRLEAENLEQALSYLLTQLSDAVSVQSVLSPNNEQLRFSRLARQKAGEIREATRWLQQSAGACRAVRGGGLLLSSAVLEESLRRSCALAIGWAERLEGGTMVWDDSQADVVTSAIAATAGMHTAVRVLMERDARSRRD
jgi:hypothetical protein